MLEGIFSPTEFNGCCGFICTGLFSLFRDMFFTAVRASLKAHLHKGDNANHGTCYCYQEMKALEAGSDKLILWLVSLFSLLK